MQEWTRRRCTNRMKLSSVYKELILGNSKGKGKDEVVLLEKKAQDWSRQGLRIVLDCLHGVSPCLSLACPFPVTET